MVDFIRARKLDFDGSPNLQKAREDYYEYAIGLKSGLVFTFCEAKQNGEFITLVDAKPVGDPTGGEMLWGRPVDVRLSEIAWVADCES